MTEQPADAFAVADCPYGEGQNSGSGCIKPVGHDGPHVVTPGVAPENDTWRPTADRTTET
jgi:hypothetical protein